ncbi:MAG: CPBP family intramembrane glutamic endopeptidase, partial [Nitrospirota bacterium]|nr:CPBP family intramembrane glutamic endopeptidase [Nitrospirota bacterium]
LLVPSGISVIRATGMRVVPRGWSPAFLFTIGLFALGMIGGWVLGFLAGGTTDALHWTDWFDSMLVEGTIFQVLASLFSYTILAPVLEELVFRGVLFASLRRRFSANISIILSAIPFALAHGYGTLGSLTIFWSGILWAWAYEKTGSLVPGILAHALNNGLVFLMVLLLIRPG